MKTLLVAAALALVLAASATAAPPVPASERATMTAILTGLGAMDYAYMPTSIPPRYRLEATQLTTQLSALTFTDPKYPKASPNFEKYAITFSTKPYGGSITNCYRGSEGAHRVAGALVYWMGTNNVVWRCMLAPSGHFVRVYASSILVKRSALEIVVSSAKRIT